MAVKMRIAAKAVDLLPPSDNIFVDAGTTCLEVGRLLLKRPHLRLFTNSVPLIALAAEARATLTGIGGEIRKMSLALTGGFTQAWLADLHFDAAVVGAAGLDPTQGAYTSEIHEAAIKTEALRRAVTRVLVADAEKWNRPTAVRFAPWNAFTFFVSNRKPYHVAGSALAAQNVRLQLTDFPA